MHFTDWPGTWGGRVSEGCHRGVWTSRVRLWILISSGMYSEFIHGRQSCFCFHCIEAEIRQLVSVGVSENSVPHCTQWFCWSLSLWRMAISLGIYPTFSDKAMYWYISWPLRTLIQAPLDLVFHPFDITKSNHIFLYEACPKGACYFSWYMIRSCRLCIMILWVYGCYQTTMITHW